MLRLVVRVEAETWRLGDSLKVANIQAAQTQLRAKTTKEIVKGRENATTWSSSSISQCNHHLKVPCSRITSIGALSFRTSADVAKLPHNIGDSETLFLVSFVSTCFFVFLSSKNMVTFPMTTYQPKKTCLISPPGASGSSQTVSAPARRRAGMRC